MARPRPVGATERGCLLDPIERAIRSALAKGDAADRAFREKVYRQAFAALERALQANSGLTVETAIKRRKSLQAKITDIEAEYLPGYVGRAAAAPPAPPAVEMPRAAARETQPSATVDALPARDEHEDMAVAPDVVVETDGGATPDVPDIMVETEPEIRPAPDVRPSRPNKPRSRRLAIAATTIFLVCLCAIGGWSAYRLGLIGGTVEDLGAGIEAPAESESFEPGAEGQPASAGQVDPQQNWINVFTPTQPATVSTPGDASAEAMQESTGPFMRIRSGTSGSAILFDIGQGVLQQIAGKKATFDIVTRAEDGKETEISVACNFGELGDCGRKRYAVTGARADYLFDVDVPVGDPGAGGTIAINSDFSNSGKAVDIFEIKVTVDSAASR